MIKGKSLLKEFDLRKHHIFFMVLSVFLLILNIWYLSGFVQTSNKQEKPRFVKQWFGTWEYKGEIKGVLTSSFTKQKEKAQIQVERGNKKILFEFPLNNSSITSNNDTLQYTVADKTIEARYSFLPIGLKEEIIFNSPPSKNTFTNTITLENLKPFTTSNGNIIFYDQNNNYQFHFQQPYIKDAKGTVSYNVNYSLAPITALDYSSTPLFQEILKENQIKQQLFGAMTEFPAAKTYILTIQIDQEWLNSKDRAYPLTLDPTVVHETSSQFSSGQMDRITNAAGSTILTELGADANTVALYHFNNSWNDSSDNALNGSATGATFSTSSKLGSHAGNFNGSSYTTVANNALLNPTNQITFEAWFYPIDASGYRNVLVKPYAAGVTGTQYFITRDIMNDKIHIGIKTGGSMAFAWSTNTWTSYVNTWVHVAGTYDGSYLRIYVNGVLNQEVPKTGLMDVGSEPLGIGGHSSTSYLEFNGRIDEVRISNVARSLEEIQKDAGIAGQNLEIAYKETPVDINTVGMWRMENNWNDSSQNNITGTATNTTFVSDAPFSSYAGNFNGTSAFVNMGTTSLLHLSSDFTAEAWFKTSDNTGDFRVLLSKGTSNDWLFAISKLTTQSMNCKLYNAGAGTGYLEAHTPMTVNDNKWHHYACVVSGTAMHVYLDGELVASDTSPWSTRDTSSAGAFYIGKFDYSSPYYWQGYVDEVHISNIARSGEEIRAHAKKRPNGVYTSNVIDLTSGVSKITSLNSLFWQSNTTPPTLPTGWTKAKPIIIDNSENSSALTNYQVKIEVPYDSNMQADFDDLLFSDRTNGTNLPYYIENKTDANTATVWVKVNSIPANSKTTIFMYYGNPAATAASSSTDTFDFFDDFTGAAIDTNKWTVDNATGWTVSGGQLRGTNTTGRIHSTSTFSSGVIQEVKTRTVTIPTNGFVIAGFYATTSNGFGFLQFSTDYYRSDAAWTAIANPIPDTSDSLIRISVVSGTTVKYEFINLLSNSLNGSGTVTNTVSNEAIYLGYRYDSLYGGQAYDNYWDWVRVRKYTSPEPSVSIGGGVEFQTRTSADGISWDNWIGLTSENTLNTLDTPSLVPQVDIRIGQKAFWGFYSHSSACTTVDNNRVVAAANGGNGYTDYASMKVQTTATSSFGYNSGSNSFNSGSTYYNSLATLTNSSVVNTYRDGGNSNYGTALIGTFTNSDIAIPYASYGSEYVFNAAQTDYISTTKLDNTHFLTTYTDVGNSSHGTAIIGTVSGTTISYGSEYVFNAASTQYTSVTTLDNTHVLIAFYDANGGRAVIGTISGTTISFGSVYAFNNLGSTSYISAAKLSTTKTLIAYSDISNSSKGTAVLATVSGTTISFSEEFVFNNASTSYIASDSFNENDFIIAYVDGGNGSYGTVISGTVVGAQLVFSAERVFDPTYSAQYIDICTLNNTHFVVAYNHTTGQSYMRQRYLLKGSILKNDSTSYISDSVVKIEGSASTKYTLGDRITDGVIGQWHLDETGGTAAYITDTSGNSNNGTPTGTSLVDGYYGKARSFNGTSDYILIPANSLFDFTGDYTLEAWVKPASLPGAVMGIMGKHNDNGWGLNINSTNKANFGMHACSNFDGTTTLTPNTWYHVAGVFRQDGSEEIYVNGKLDAYGSLSSGNCNNDASDVVIGKYRTAGYFNGIIDEVRISNVARSAYEINQSYRSGKDEHISFSFAGTDLSTYTKIPFYIASEKLGTLFEARIGNTAQSMNKSDTNSDAVYHFEDRSHYRATDEDTKGYDFVSASSLTTNVAASANGGTVIPERQQTGYPMSGSIDGVETGTGGWAYDGIVPTKGIYKFVSKKLINSITLISGIDRPDHNPTDFYLYYTKDASPSLTGNWYAVPSAYLKNVTQINGQVVNGNEIQVYSGQDNVQIGFTPVEATGVMIAITASNTSTSSNSVITEFKVFEAKPITWTKGKIGNGIYFNGTNSLRAEHWFDSATTTPFYYNFDHPFTIDAWIKTINTSSYQIIVSTIYNASPFMGIEFGVNSDGRLVFDLTNTWQTNLIQVYSTEKVHNDMWHHVGVTYDGSANAAGVQFYIDSKPVDKTITYNNLTGGTISALPPSIGSRSESAYFFVGIIDELRASGIAQNQNYFREIYQQANRTHPITIDFAASLDAGNLINNTSDTSFTIDGTTKGLPQKGSNLFVEDKIIIKENYNGTVYIAQGAVSSVNASTGAVTVASWDSGSTVPSSGFSTNATVFKWQREYWDITNINPADRNNTTSMNFDIRVLDTDQAFDFWVDNIQSSNGYIATLESAISSTPRRYFQYRALFSSPDMLSPLLQTVSLNYTVNNRPNYTTMDAPTNGQTNQSLTPMLKTTTTDKQSDVLKYKIQFCSDAALTQSCQTFDQTVFPQTNWSGQNEDDGSSYASGTQATYTLSTPLSQSSTYYWRSWAIDQAGSGYWSPTHATPYSFTTSNPPTSPTTLYTNEIVNNTSVTTHNPLFSAIHNDPNGDPALFYEIEVNTASDFTGTVKWDSGKTVMSSTANGARSPDITYAGTNLSAANDTFYWRIRFWDDKGAQGAWSATNQFTMNVECASPTVLHTNNVLNNPDVTTHNPLFSAIHNDPNADAAVYYEVEVNTASDFNGTVKWDSGKTVMSSTANGARSPDITYAGTNLSAANDTFYWRIRFWDDKGAQGAWSATNQFTMNVEPTAPTTLYTEGSVNHNNVNDITPEFSAIHNDPNSDPAVHYQIEVNTASNFSGTVMWDSTKTVVNSTANGTRSPDITYAGTTLTLQGNVYYWRIRFWDDKGAQGAWSATNQFRMGQKPDIPTLNSPDNNATRQAWTPSFSITTTDLDGDYIKYKIVLCRNSAMTDRCAMYSQVTTQTGWSGQNTQNDTAYDSETTATYTLQTANALESNTTYYWKAYAVDPAGTNMWSETQVTPRSFTTEHTPSTPTVCFVTKNTDNTEASVTWQDKSNNEDAFTVQKSINGGAFATIATKDSNSTSHTADAISSGNNYVYRIRSSKTINSITRTSQWCTTSTLNVGTGNVRFDNLKIDGGFKVY